MILYLIRHGKTFCNEKKLYCGKSDIELSDKGREEIKEKIKEFNFPDCKNNYTTGLKRTNETFKLIYKNKDFEVLEGFREYDFGDFELKSYEELKENKEYLNWILDESLEFRVPKGESRKEFKTRIEKSLISLIDSLEKNNEKEALVLCHGGTIASLLESFNEENKSFYDYHPNCIEGYTLKVLREKGKLKLNILERF
ncbi:histidine phosphatase family protein [Clostridium chrysemydis]|uniref:histidine phosphatase family protein n=1 Tax=Clostridium chrysemydis TaxID=2665504 RepID=UPI001883692E|nr:histidine phosphatase family protein [Clostridium chrysemydis]